MKKIIFMSFMLIALIFSACKSKEKESSDDVELTPTNEGPAYLTKADFLTEVHNLEQSPDEWIFLGEIPCIILFTADWCPPCKALKPIYDELAEEYAGKVNFYKIDVDEEKFFRSNGYAPVGIPTLLFCSKNSDTVSTVGWDGSSEAKAELIQKIDDFLR